MELLAKLEYLDHILREGFACLEHSSGAVRTARDIKVDGRPGQADMDKLTENDFREWKLTMVDSQERSTWRSGMRSVWRAASQLPVRGPTYVDISAPASKSKI